MNINDNKEILLKKLTTVLKAIDDLPVLSGGMLTHRPCPKDDGNKIACMYLAGDEDACVRCWTNWLERNIK